MDVIKLLDRLQFDRKDALNQKVGRIFAHSRDTSVRGALRAAEWLLDQPRALYSMADVLGIK